MKRGKPKNTPNTEVVSQQTLIALQVVEAKELGVAEIVKLLQQPEDLTHLEAIRAEYDAKHKANKAQLSATVISQVEAVKQGLELLDKAVRHIAKMRQCFTQIDKLCAECMSLIENHHKIRALSLAHMNVLKVLEEIVDIIDLPSRADGVLSMLDDASLLLPAFEGLTVLEGIGNNAKHAWVKNVKKREEITDLSQYLNKVTEVVDEFEKRLWGLCREYNSLAQSEPQLLVNVVRIIEMQERLDKQFQAHKLETKPKYYRDRCMLEIEKAIEERFVTIMAQAERCLLPNKKVRVDQHSNIVTHEERDYLGTLAGVTRLIDNKEVQASPAELSTIEVMDQEVFDEDIWLDTLVGEMNEVQQDLVEAFDHVAPCFPTHYAVFDQIQQHFHVRFARVIDIVGQKADQLSSKGVLHLLQWVSDYQNVLMGLNVEPELCYLPVAPDSDPESKPGMELLLGSYQTRMEATINTWVGNILEADLSGQPKQALDGTLRTPGATDFFHILNEEVMIMERVSTGEVLYQAAKAAQRVMRNFMEAQLKVLKRELSLEFFCAFLNNNVECYDQALDFTDQVTAELQDDFKEKLDVDEICRGFLDVAKVALQRIVDVIFEDPGMASNMRQLFITADWLSGNVTATILATIGDYFGDLKTFVKPTFFKRLVEATLDDLVRRWLSQFFGATPSITAALSKRLKDDEEEINAFFSTYIKLEKASRHTAHVAELHDLSEAVEEGPLLLAYTNILEINSGITPAMMEKLLSMRTNIKRAMAAEVVAQCKDVYQQRMKAVNQGVAAPPGTKSWWGGFWK